jgi:serine protease Do
VLSIGQPAGNAPTLSAGIFSARRRGLLAGSPAEEWLETDAAVNARNSGGPLVNLNGEVVGISTALTGRHTEFDGMGFAIPSDRARRIAADLVEFGRVRRAFLGVQVEPAGAVRPGRSTPQGSVVIASVGPGTPAADAGLRAGDVVVKIAGQPVAGVGMLQGLVETAPIGKELVLTIERGGKWQDVVVRPQAQPTPSVASPGTSLPSAVPEARRDVLRSRPHRADQVVPREAPPPLPVPSGDETPSVLEPIPVREPARTVPTLGPSQYQAQGKP